MSALTAITTLPQPGWNAAQIVLELHEHLVESVTVEPTFYRDFPVEVSPLTRQHRSDPRLAEKWDLVAFGTEIATAYSELVDLLIGLALKRQAEKARTKFTIELPKGAAGALDA